MKQKLTTGLSTEELLSALNNVEQNSTVFTSSDPFYTFLEVFQIKTGNHRIAAKLLNNLYRKWNHKFKGKDKDITSNLCKYIDTVTISKRNYYLINKDLENIVRYFEDNEKIVSKSKRSVKSIKKHFISFLEQNNIKPGNLYIESDVFYHVYDTWCYKNRKNTHLSYARFISTCEIFFQTKYFEGSNLMWFGVDPSIKQYISVQAVRNWREGRTRRGKISNVKEENIIYPEAES